MDAEIVKGAITGTSGEAISVGQGVYIKASDNKYYKTVGTGDESTYSFAGVALTAAGGADVAFTFAPPGHVVTTSGLTAGAYYFVSDTAGTLATTPGTRFARVGRALSTTLLQVLDPKFIRRGSFTVSGTGNTSVTTGFYPAHIQIRAACDSGGAGGYGLFSIGDDSNTCVRKVGGTGANDDAVNGSAAASLRLATPADALLGTVSAKSATGFTFNTSAYSADGGNLTNHTIQWAAFSE
jgi:hypothetical protein